MNLWLDDIRTAPEGWVHCWSVPELISAYLHYGALIETISLDHDLGEDLETGYDFLSWLEKQVFTGLVTVLPRLVVHSANPVGRANMERCIESMQRLLGVD
jgi:hypothetical protein